MGYIKFYLVQSSPKSTSADFVYITIKDLEKDKFYLKKDGDIWYLTINTNVYYIIFKQYVLYNFTSYYIGSLYNFINKEEFGLLTELKRNLDYFWPYTLNIERKDKFIVNFKYDSDSDVGIEIGKDVVANSTNNC